MPEFFNVLAPNLALQTLLARLPGPVAAETVPTRQAMGRVTAAALVAPEHLPRLDGLATLREIMSKNPRPVIMLSSLTKEGARETVQALTATLVHERIEAIVDALAELAAG